MSPDSKFSPASMSAKNFGWGSFFVVVLAGFGQFFLSQVKSPIGLGLGIGFYAISLYSLFLLFRKFQPVEQGPCLKPWMEWTIFLLILAAGILLRAYGTNRYPMGVFADRAEVACGALRILHGEWHPFLSALDQHVGEICIYYMVAGWFWLFGTSPEAFSYFDVTLSTLGILFSYFFFRQVLGAVPALLAFFFLSVMRWNFAFAHQVYFQSQTVLFMSLVLALLFYAFKKASWIAAGASGLMMAAGLYSYQSFKAVPLFLLSVFLFEQFFEKEKFERQKEIWMVFGLIFLLAASPLMLRMVQKGELGHRESEVSVLNIIHAQQSLMPLLTNLRDAAEMFNRTGDSNTQSNFQSHRMLDDVTGMLFVLGFFYALSRMREFRFFLGVAGICVMCLPSILSINGGHAGRMLGTTPFIAYLCVLLVREWWRRFRVIQPERSKRWPVACFLGVFLIFAAAQNAYAYFAGQVQDPACQDDCSWAESQAGGFIARQNASTQCFLPSRFYGHPTVKFLTYPRWDDMQPLEISALPIPSRYPKGTSFCFLLDDFKMGVLQLLQTTYPGGQTEAFRDPIGQTVLLAYQISAEVLKKLKFKKSSETQGLEGVYQHSDDPKEKPFLVRKDPILNFTFRDLPGTGDPLFIHWSGKFKVAEKGLYHLWLVTYESDQACFLVDGRKLVDWVPSPSAAVVLKPGWHRLDIDFRNVGTPLASVNLLWKKPGQDRYGFMTAQVFSAVTSPVMSNPP